MWSWGRSTGEAFKEGGSTRQAALDDSSIFNELSPELRTDVVPELIFGGHITIKLSLPSLLAGIRHENTKTLKTQKLAKPTRPAKPQKPRKTIMISLPIRLPRPSQAEILVFLYFC